MTVRVRATGLAVGAALAGCGLVPLSAGGAAAAAQTYACVATPTYPATWDGGFDVQFVITNTGTATINTWLVTFDLPNGDSMYTTWNGDFTQSGQHVAAQNYPGAALPPGASVDSFGGVVLGPGPDAVTNVTCTAGFAPVEWNSAHHPLE